VLVLAAVLLAIGCERDPRAPSQVERALTEVKRLYEKGRDGAPDDPVEWAKEDFQRWGDWEYRIVVMADGDLASVETQLNELGKERWEVFWIERTDSGLRVFMKRSAISYLRSVPVPGLGKALSGGSGE